MAEALRLAIPAAFLLVVAGAFFGVAMARLIWADNLVFAQSLDEIRSRTEEDLRKTIGHQEGTIAALQEHVQILQNKP